MGCWPPGSPRIWCAPCRSWCPCPAGRGPPRRAAGRRGYYGAGVALYDAFAGLFGRRPGHAAAPAPEPATAARQTLPVACGRTRSPVRSATTTGRSTTRGSWSRWRVPRRASARPWCRRPGVGLLRDAREVTGVRRTGHGARPGDPDAEFDVSRPHGHRGDRGVERRRDADARPTSACRPGCGCARPRACTWWCPGPPSPARPG